MNKTNGGCWFCKRNFTLSRVHTDIINTIFDTEGLAIVIMNNEKYEIRKCYI